MSREGPPSPAPAPAAVLYAEQPSDLTLVKNILGPWVATRVNNAAEAHVVDIYSAEPDELARMYQPTVSKNGERAWYFLSSLSLKGRGGSHKSRTVIPESAGSWRTEDGPKHVIDHLDGGRLVGYRQKLSFMRREGADGERVRTGWVMAEFHIHQYDAEGGAGRKVEGLILGKIYRGNRRRVPTAVTPDPDASGDAAAATAPDGGGETTPAAAAPGPKPAPPARKRAAAAAGNVERSGAKTDNNGETEPTSSAAAAPGPKPAPPARKRAAVAASNDDESPGAEKAAGAAWLHCPRCRFHLGALQAIVTPIDDSESI